MRGPCWHYEAAETRITSISVRERITIQPQTTVHIMLRARFNSSLFRLARTQSKRAPPEFEKVRRARRARRVAVNQGGGGGGGGAQKTSRVVHEIVRSNQRVKINTEEPKSETRVPKIEGKPKSLSFRFVQINTKRYAPLLDPHPPAKHLLRLSTMHSHFVRRRRVSAELIVGSGWGTEENHSP